MTTYLSNERLDWLATKSVDIGPDTHEIGTEDLRALVAEVLEFRLTSRDEKALNRAYDDVTRMSSLDDDALPQTKKLRREALAILKRQLIGGRPTKKAP